MLRKHFSIILTIAIVSLMSLMASGRNDLGVGVDIDNGTLNFTVYSSGLRLIADFTTSYAATESLSDPSEGEVDLKLPVWGKKKLSISLEDKRKAMARFIVTVSLQTLELQNEPQLDKKSYDTEIASQRVIVNGELYDEQSRWEVRLEAPIKIACYGEITKIAWTVVTNPDYAPRRDANDIPIEFIPLVDENGRLLLCKDESDTSIITIEVPVVKVITNPCESTSKETFSRLTTWTKIILRQEEKEPPPCPQPTEPPPLIEPPLCEETAVPRPPCYLVEHPPIPPKVVRDVIAEVPIRTVRCGVTTWTKIISEMKEK